MIDQNRIQSLNSCQYTSGPVVYWMSRDQRVHDNWALLTAQAYATKYQVPLVVCFSLLPKFLHAQDHQFRWMIEGLQEVEQTLKQFQIPFFLLHGEPTQTIPQFLSTIHAGMLVTDMSPLHIAKTWKQTLTSTIRIPFYQVDAHNIIPVWTTSQKQEFAARTIRPKIYRMLSNFLTPYPQLNVQTIQFPQAVQLPRWPVIHSNNKVILKHQSGEKHARQHMKHWVSGRLERYDTDRNNPNLHGQSELSAYVHFGQLSSQTIVLHIMNTKQVQMDELLLASHKSKDSNISAFFEELVVRKELADNFCYYNDHYDAVEGFPSWAKLTLDRHRKDKREFEYSLEQFEQAQTHDPLWNAAQQQLLKTATMHGYLRMYWAKKILEWSPDPETALTTAIYLNDTYQLDGRDPNGYTGIAWSIGGVHDRPWFERSVYGTIRYMNDKGMERKFSTEQYVKRWTNET